MKIFKLKNLFLYLLFLTVFLFPNATDAAIEPGSLKTSTVDGMKKISFTSDCSIYTTQTKFPKSGTSGVTAGPQLEQNIYYNESGSGDRDIIWFQHGDGGCGSAPRNKCESSYFNASTILTHPNNGQNQVLFCPEMNPSGTDTCYKHWSKKYSTFFSCLYKDFRDAFKQGSSIDPTTNVIFASHSQGGPASHDVVMKPPANVNVTKIVRFDSCYSNYCLEEAKLPIPLLTYASNKPTPPEKCPPIPKGQTWCGNPYKNQEATIAKKIYEQPNTASYLLPNGDHGDVPTQCKTAVLDSNPDCGGKAQLAGGSTTNIAGSSVSYVSAPGVFSETKLILSAPSLQIKIPGLSNLSVADIRKIEENNNTYIIIPFLGKYLAALYRYGVVAASIIAVVMIINNGLKWSISGGSPEKIKEAQTRIIQSITGLLLAVGSYALLFNINPELVQFRNLRVLTVKGRALTANESVLPEDFVYPPGNYLTGPLKFNKQPEGASVIPKKGKTGIFYGYNNIPYFRQYDSRWAKKVFGDGSLPVCTCQHNPTHKACQKTNAKPTDHAGDNGNEFGKICCTDIAHGGCNVTSYAMILKYLGKPADPEIMAALAVEAGARVCNGGITSKLRVFHDAIEKKWPDLKVEYIKKEQDKMILLLKQKTPLITHHKQEGHRADGTIKTYKGHFVVLTGADDNWVYVNDPGGNNGITHMTHKQAKDHGEFIYIHKK